MVAVELGRTGEVEMAEKIREFWRNDSGATAIEYGLIAAIAGIGMIASLGTLKNALSGMFANVSTNLNVN